MASYGMHFAGVKFACNSGQVARAKSYPGHLFESVFWLSLFEHLPGFGPSLSLRLSLAMVPKAQPFHFRHPMHEAKVAAPILALACSQELNEL